MRPRGGVVTQRPAKPWTPVRFRAWPPAIRKKSIKSSWRLAQALIYPPHQYGNISPVAQLVEQTAVNRSVAGSSPAWGAIYHSVYRQFMKLFTRRGLARGGVNRHHLYYDIFANRKFGAHPPPLCGVPNIYF